MPGKLTGLPVGAMFNPDKGSPGGFWPLVYTGIASLFER
jgi:hypothetical protein